MRTWALACGGLAFRGTSGSGPEIAFEVARSLKAEPNTASIRVWGLSEDQRGQLEALSVAGKRPGRIATRLEAGSEGEQFLLFAGDLRYARSERDGATWVTTIEGDDGGRAFLDAQVRRAFPPGTPLATVARECANALGLGLGNLDLALRGLTQVSEAGTVISGRASEELRGVLRALGLTYSIQHGVIQVLPRGSAALQVPIRKLSPTSGLIASPCQNAEGYLEATSLLLPGLDPGVRVAIESRRVRGTYRVRSVRYQGDASAVDWYAALELDRAT